MKRFSLFLSASDPENHHFFFGEADRCVQTPIPNSTKVDPHRLLALPLPADDTHHRYRLGNKLKVTAATQK